MSRPRFITLHDVFGYTHRDTAKGRMGREIRVRTDAVDTMTSYDDNDPTKTIIGVHGAFHHVSETAEEILNKIDRIAQGY